jgi:hypothetical protein
MPCKDITELLEIVLDADDRLVEYTFSKRTCGQGVGAAALLIDQLRGRSAHELQHKTAAEFLDEFPIADPIEEFLSLKHLFAVQSALEVYAGTEAGRASDAFALAGIEYGEDTTRIHGRIAVDVVTERIEACGNCGSCGKADEGRELNRKRRAARAAGTTASA